MWRHDRTHTGLDSKGSHKAKAESVSDDLHITASALTQTQVVDSYIGSVTDKAGKFRA